MSMQRASRLRRFAVAFVVILLIAVAFRFARAAGVAPTLGASPCPTMTS